MDNENRFTSYRLSKKLSENNCELPSESNWIMNTSGIWGRSSSDYIHNKKNKLWLKKRAISKNTLGNGICLGMFQKSIEENGFKMDDLRVAYPCYDILNEICVKYSQEFFGTDMIKEEIDLDLDGSHPITTVKANFHSWSYYPEMILSFMQGNRKNTCEEYIWDNCKFNEERQRG